MELLAAHVSGDTRAFAELFRRHQNHLWRVARRTSYNDEDAADALQEAMLSAHRTAASFRADAAVLSWLHRIVVNACLDRLRRNKVRATVQLHDYDAVFSHAATEPISGLELTLDIERALFTLPPSQRAAVVLVDIEGRSVAEAADLLGVPIGTVKSRCARARSKLALLLEDLRYDGNQRTWNGVYSR